jgi:L,D-peptidoglycan transpeptidase YkuD (ErfK/YbiS/YcfS/YnhG family)
VDLAKTDTVCVDDLASPDYGKVAPRSSLPAGTKGEAMSKEALYRRGLIIEAPADRTTKTGSCIFFHVWRGEDRPTAGCVALAEQDVAHLQAQARPDTVVAILPRGDLHRFAACLPSSAD